jgi:hypothetical protein
MLGPILIANLLRPPSGKTIANFVDTLSTLTSLIALIVPCPQALVIGALIRLLPPCHLLVISQINETRKRSALLL